MKKIITFALALGLTAYGLTGCNKQLFDFTYEFDKAIIQLPDGSVISGKVQAWTDYEGDQLQVKINGKTYLVHSSKMVLIQE